jgi:hypothetical protein
VHVAIAIGVLLGSRPALAFGIYAALTGLMAVVLGPSAGWPPAWIAANAVYGLVLAAIGILAWRALSRTTAV